MTCTPRHYPFDVRQRQRPDAVASRKNCRCCAIICCGSTATAAMTASMASWMTASSSATPRNAPMMAPSLSPISRTVWCAARRNCIRRINPRTHCPRSLSASRRPCAGRASAASCSARLIPEARAKGYQALRITTGAQNEAMRALANKFGAQLTFRHGESTGTIDLKPQPQFELAKLAIATPTDATRAMVQVQPRLLEGCYWECMAGAGRPEPRPTKSNSPVTIRRMDATVAEDFRCRCACRCRSA